MLELHGLSAAPRQPALSPDQGRTAGVPPRAQRIGPRIATHAHRRTGELSAAGRNSGGAGSVAALYGRSGANSPTLAEAITERASHEDAAALDSHFPNVRPMLT